MNYIYVQDLYFASVINSHALCGSQRSICKEEPISEVLLLNEPIFLLFCPTKIHGLQSFQSLRVSFQIKKSRKLHLPFLRLCND